MQAQVLNLLRDLQAAHGLTYLFIAHNLAVVRYIADRIGVMYLGKLVETAPGDELYRQPRHPYTQALLSAIPQPRPGQRQERIVLGGDVPSPLNPTSRLPVPPALCPRDARVQTGHAANAGARRRPYGCLSLVRRRDVLNADN